ncbi:FAD binding domain-containing protein [Bradyrhizobium sp. HKCCYLS1011]|uniref:FAD binding domain-containing protein n=1 Tax=Bradyrhizobium sp. HKCCYLS1011 TaxID=3420733 RepID=UPI003EB7717D
MKASAFAYHDPRSCSDLVDLLAKLDNAKLLAGGQSLMPMLNLRVVAPDHLIDINRIPELAGIRLAADAVELGAMTRQSDLLDSPDLAVAAPIFRAALAHVGHVQTRSRGTFGGSCCHLDPAAELPALCALLDAEFDVVGAGGSRVVKARDWFKGYLESALDERELLRSIRWQRWPGGHGYGFSEYARRRGDFAIAGAAALLELNTEGAVRRAAIVVFGVEPSPVRLAETERALTGRRLDSGAIDEAVAEARRLDPMSDVHVSAAYRRHLAGIVTMRALADAARNAEMPT